MKDTKLTKDKQISIKKGICVSFLRDLVLTIGNFNFVVVWEINKPDQKCFYGKLVGHAEEIEDLMNGHS